MGKTFNRYIMTDGVKSIDLPQFPNEAWTFYGEADDDGKEDFYATVAAVFRATNLTASATANIPFALVDKSGKDYDVSTEWENKVIFMPKPKELIRLWRLSLIMTNEAYGFMENKKDIGKNLRYIVPTTITPITDNEKGLTGFKRTVGTGSKDYPLDKKNPIFWMWRMDHTTELLPAKATEFQAMCAAAGILYYSDHFVNAFFKRGGIKPTMLVLKGMTTKENIDKIESVWDKIIKGGYKYLGKIFQGVDTNGGLEAQTIGEGVDTLKDETLTKAKIEDVAMSIGMPLSLLLANSANYATAQVEYKEWYENSLAPWCSFIADEMTDKLFKPLGLRFEFRPEMTDPGQEDEVARASAYSTYVSAGIKPSVAAKVIGMELPEGIEYESLDEMQEEKRQQAIELMQKKQSSSDNGKEEKPDAVQKEKEKVKGWVTINGNHVLIGEEEINSFQKILNLDKSKTYYVRWSRGYELDKEQRNSLDQVSGQRHNGLSAQNLRLDDPRLMARMIPEYRFLRRKDAKIYPWIFEGNRIGTDSDEAPLIDVDSIIPVGKISEPLIEKMVRYSNAANDMDQKYRWNAHTPESFTLNEKIKKEYEDSWGDLIGNKSKAKFIPSLDQLHELETWRKFAFRKFKKGESLDFPFEIKTLPDEISEDIKLQLLESTDEEGIKAAFTLDDIQFEPMQDTAILKLADAINKACENVAVPD